MLPPLPTQYVKGYVVLTCLSASVFTIWLITNATKSWFSFKVTAEMVEPFLDGLTLEEALKKKKIYISNLKKLTEIMCRFNRVVSYITC